MNLPEGHRQRLRQRFNEKPASLAEAERLELLLSYAIPRRDIAPLARELIERFGSLEAVLTAPAETLSEAAGLGEFALTLFRLIQSFLEKLPDEQANMIPAKPKAASNQLSLFEPEQSEQAPSSKPGKKERQMRVFANDEVANSLSFLPQAANYRSLEEYKKNLKERLPYNAAETRQRRANYIIERFFSDDSIDTPLAYFATHCSTEADLKPVVFYHILKAEPIAWKVAEEFIWPALPLGRIEREQLREFVLRYLPEASDSSQKNMLRAIFYTYDLLGIGSVHDNILRFHLREGTLESFLYILTSEFAQPGIYSFDALFNGPTHRWMLWDREWMRRQLYNLQDFGILTKVSEIDTVRQFSLGTDQQTALLQFFEHPERKQMAIRESEGQQDFAQER